MEEIDIVEQSHTSAVEWSKLLKMEIVNKDGVGTDIVPTVLVLSSSDELVTMIGKARNLRAAFTLVAGVSAMHPAAVSVLWESYQRFGSEFLDYEHGDLAKAFADGDESVKETITIVTSALDQDCFLTILPYKYAGKEVVWLEATNARAPVEGEEMGGVLHDQFRASLRATEDTPEDIRSHLDEMEASGLDGWMAMANMLIDALGEDVTISLMAKADIEDILPGAQPPSNN